MPSWTRTYAHGSANRSTDPRGVPRRGGAAGDRREPRSERPAKALGEPVARGAARPGAGRPRLGAPSRLPAAASPFLGAPVSPDAADPEGTLRGAHPRLGGHDAQAARGGARGLPGIAQASAREAARAARALPAAKARARTRRGAAPARARARPAPGR